MLASIVADHLITEFATEDTVVLSSYYDYKDGATQHTDNMIAALLKQVIQICRTVNGPMELLHNTLSKGSKPSTDDLFGVLVSILNGVTRTFVVLDALDECSDHTRRAECLGLLGRLRTECSDIRLFLTSRQVPLIDQLVSVRPLQFRAADGDIALFVEDHIAFLSFYIPNFSSQREHVKQKIIKSANGMCVCSSISHLSTI